MSLLTTQLDNQLATQSVQSTQPVTWKIIVLLDRCKVLLCELRTATNVSISNYISGYNNITRDTDENIIHKTVLPKAAKYQAIADYVNNPPESTDPNQTAADLPNTALPTADLPTVELGVLHIGEFDNYYEANHALLESILRYKPILQVYDGRNTRTSYLDN